MWLGLSFISVDFVQFEALYKESVGNLFKFASQQPLTLQVQTPDMASSSGCQALSCLSCHSWPSSVPQGHSMFVCVWRGEGGWMGIGKMIQVLVVFWSQGKMLPTQHFLG